MIKLTFSSESNDSGVVSATKEYQTIWNEDGTRIIAVMENMAGLKFSQTEIGVIVYEGISYSGYIDLPMKLRASYPKDIKKGTLVHELGHRLIEQLTNRPDDTDEHQLLFLVLYDIWVAIYGQEFADKMVKTEELRTGLYDYKTCWADALTISKKERYEKFNLVKNLNGL